MTRAQKVTGGRVVAALAVLAAIYAVTCLVVSGHPYLLVEEWVPQMALPAVGFGVLGWLAVPHQPDNRAIWATTSGALLTGIATSAWATTVVFGDTAIRSPAEASTMWALVVALYDAAGWPGIYLILTLGLLLFPNGDPPSPRWSWVGWLSLASIVSLGATFLWIWRPGSSVAYDSETHTGIGSLLVPLVYLLIILCGVSVASLVVGYRRSTGAIRQQYRWIVLGGTMLFFSFFAVGIAELMPVILTGVWERVAIFGGLGSLIVSYGIAVTKYRLYDIDLVISRTLVFGALATFIGIVYVLVVVGAGNILGAGSDNLILSVAATATVAIAFEPVRRWARGWANRLVFGMRATPYHVLSDLAHRLAGAEPADEVLNRMARLMVEGTGAEQATVWLVDGDQLSASAAFPQIRQPRVVDSVNDLGGAVYPVVHEEKLVGALQVTKARGNPVTPPEQRLLSDLARSAGLVLGNQRLNAALIARAEELRASLRRLAEIQDIERRRLERDLHDGAQQNVVALKVQVRLAEQAARAQGVEPVADLLAEVAEDAQAAVEEIRSLARGIYPPLLESEGLETAVRSQAAALPIAVEVESQLRGRFSRDVEAAMYFVVAEALANAVKHGSASRIRIRLPASSDALTAVVSDDGVGFNTAQASHGMGLVNIRDRIEALGGDVQFESEPGAGTRVTARIPLGDDRRLTGNQ